MNTVHRPFPLSIGFALACAGVLFCNVAPAADNAPAADAAARYKQERAACLNDTSSQDRATCLREAGAAQAQGKQGVPDAATAQLERNATKRCDALPDDERKACLARMQGQGSTSGSVAGGGIVRELVTPAPAASAPAAAPAK